MKNGLLVKHGEAVFKWGAVKARESGKGEPAANNPSFEGKTK